MEIQTEGFADLDRKLQQIPEDVARRIMADALLQGVKPIKEDAQRKAPVHRGVLRRSIRVRIQKMVSNAVEATIGVRGKEAFIARFVEMGTAPHTIGVKKAALATLPKKGLANKETGQFFGKSVKHPGTAPHPFLRSAIEAKGPEAVEIMGRVLMKEIDERYGQR